MHAKKNMAWPAWLADMSTAGLRSVSMPKASNIGSFIRERRRELRLSQESLAREMKVSRNTVMAWESGAHGLHSDNMAALAEALDVDVSVLYEQLGRAAGGRAVSHHAPRRTVAAVVDEYLASPRGQTAHHRVVEMLRDGAVFDGLVTAFGTITWDDCDAIRQVLERRIGSGQHPPVHAPENGMSGTRALKPASSPPAAERRRAR